MLTELAFLVGSAAAARKPAGCIRTCLLADRQRGARTSKWKTVYEYTTACLFARSAARRASRRQNGKATRRWGSQSVTAPMAAIGGDGAMAAMTPGGDRGDGAMAAIGRDDGDWRRYTRGAPQDALTRDGCSLCPPVGRAHRRDRAAFGARRDLDRAAGSGADRPGDVDLHCRCRGSRRQRGGDAGRDRGGRSAGGGWDSGGGEHE